MPKSPALTDILNNLAKQMGGGITRTEALNTYKCVGCGDNKGQFRNEISKREYNISGFCQACQDKTFGAD